MALAHTLIILLVFTFAELFTFEINISMLKEKIRSQVGRVTQIAAALANGAVTFIVLKALNSLVPDAALFSQVTTVFLLFSQYLTALDLGSHAEFLRLFPRLKSSEIPAALSNLFGFRFICCLVAIGISIAHGLVAGFSGPVFVSFLLQASTLLPLAALSVWDSYQIAQGHLVKAILLRMGRLVASLVFLLYWILSPSPQVIPSYVSFALTLWFMALVCFFMLPVMRTLRPTRQASYSGFLKTSLFVGAATVVALLFHAVAVNLIGETGMARINVAIAIITPLMIVFQTLISLALTHIFHAENPLAYRRATRKTLLKITLLALATTCVLLLSWKTGILNFVFPQSLSFWHVLVYYIGQLGAIYAVPYTAFSIHSENQRAGILVYLGLGGLGLGLLPPMIQAWGDLGYLLFMNVYWLAVILIFYGMLRLRKAA
ncbi:MAG TPA: hypothetical protein VFO10_14780 [Oligoflexus sp.]|uniref:hypothetical protein n=1 Tax=Oligoflexus sp. TaxID=1971216 RepID=UPI002D805B11|nr:hypothetical protein [Oligoflexus sp.]HET9238523.1 hypothetical protein [Oligoflexus sp.]